MGILLRVVLAWSLGGIFQTCLAQNSAPRDSAPRGAPLGGLLVAPTRVILEGRVRGAEITLVNTGPESTTYRISLVHMRMDDTGGMKEIADPEPDELLADELIRFAPRQVTLAPNLAQTVRIQLRKPADLAPGEYRSHLLFRAVPAAPVPQVDSAAFGAPALPTGMEVTLTAIYGVSIPVIVRQGETAAAVTLSDLALRDEPSADPVLRLTIRRKGNQSVYGNLTAIFSGSVGKPVVVGVAQGIAVYTPNAVRRVDLPLRVPPGTALARGTLRVVFEQAVPARDPIASAQIELP